MDEGQSTRWMGPYRLIRSLGQGGMAEVFLAVGPTGDHIAIKRLSTRCDIEGAAMMSREAQLATRLSHPNVVRTYGFDAHDNYIVMEFVGGRTVREVLNHGGESVLLPLDAALSIVHAVAQGLHAAHEARDERGLSLGLVHRDVTPSNILIDRDGTPKLSDFGIAKATLLSDATYGGPLKGKTGYMSPEQCRCEALDRRSDIFSLGAILFELTTGRRLVRGRTALATMLLTVEGTYSSPRSARARYPEELDAIVARATAHDPADRFASAREFGLALDAFADRNGLELSPRVIHRGLEQLYAMGAEDATALFRRPGAPISCSPARSSLRSRSISLSSATTAALPL